jgi:hypothetical protein
MKRSLFTKGLFCGAFGLLGCRPKELAGKDGTKAIKSKLKFYGLPHWADLLSAILPTKVFRVLEIPAPTVHSQRSSLNL